MKKLLISVAIAGLFAGAPAFAQGDDHHDDHSGPGAQHEPDHAAPNHAAQDHAQVKQQRHDAAVEHKENAMAQHDNATVRHDNATVRHDNAMVHHDNAVIQNQQHAINTQKRDFSALRRTMTAQRRFHAAEYRRPQGWYDHRWNPGERLQPAFFVQDYWINDFNDYGLQPPPDGTVWVRYGNDALLIDQYSGEVIQVDYGVFY